MMVWLIFLLLTAAILLGFWRLGAFTGGTLPFLGAAIVFAAAGYAWQGHPALPGSPAQPHERQQFPETAFSMLKGEFFGEFTAASRWLIISDSYLRRGDSESAAGVIASGLRQSPDNVELWIGYGDALVMHGGGKMNPAALLAYRRAMALAPSHPAPRFFYGFSLIQSGQIGAGEKIWRDLLESAPATAKWRPIIADRLAIIDRLKALELSEN